MIISFAFGLIGAILVFASHRPLKKISVFLIGFLVTVALGLGGIYFIRTLPEDTDKTLLFPMFSPFTALILMQISKWIYRYKYRRDIIFQVYGLIPVKQYERYVTGGEKMITYLLLVLSLIIPYFVLRFAL